MGNATAFSAAAGALADVFAGILLEGAGSFAGFEDEAIRAGHSAMVRAMGLALERCDGALCLGAGLRAHDARRQTLATEVVGAQGLARPAPTWYHPRRAVPRHVGQHRL